MSFLGGNPHGTECRCLGSPSRSRQVKRTDSTLKRDGFKNTDTEIVALVFCWVRSVEMRVESDKCSQAPVLIGCLSSVGQCSMIPAIAATSDKVKRAQLVPFVVEPQHAVCS